jgi:CRP/FNR family nitrogen fixation transcriptional regulator
MFLGHRHEFPPAGFATICEARGQTDEKIMLIDSLAGVTVQPVESMLGLTNVSASEIATENSIVDGRSKRLTLFGLGAEIFAPGAEARHLYQVEFGTVRICSLLGDGRRTVSAFHFAGEVFGFELDGHHRFRAEAVDSVGLRTIALPGMPAMAAGLLRIAVERLMQMQHHLLVVGRQTAVERVAGFLLDVASRQRQSEVIRLPMPHGDIADYLGLTPETVCRVFKHLRESGVVSYTSSRHVTVNRIEGLRQLIQ